MWEGLSIPTQIGSAPRFLLLFAQDVYWHRPEVRRTSVHTHDRGRRPGLLAMPKEEHVERACPVFLQSYAYSCY
jgi:hypothetical protein